MDLVNTENKRVVPALLLAATALMLKIIQIRSRRKKTRAPVNVYLKKRNDKGRFASDFKDMKENRKIFHKNFPMSAEAFDDLFKLVEPYQFSSCRQQVKTSFCGISS